MIIVIVKLFVAVVYVRYCGVIHISVLYLQINVQSFASLCEQFSLRVFLIDPQILQVVMSNVSHIKTKCKYLCVQNTVTSFGIIHTDLPEEVRAVHK